MIQIWYYCIVQFLKMSNQFVTAISITMQIYTNVLLEDKGTKLFSNTKHLDITD